MTASAIAWLLGRAALAGPVLGAEVDEIDPLARCTAIADGEAGDLSPITPWSGEIPQTSERIAVVVGVPCHRSPAIPSLQYSTRDAVRVSGALGQAGYTVLPLLTAVDRTDVIAALDAAEAAVAPGGTLLVYFSGHGMLQEGDGELRRYLVLSDSDTSAIRTTGIEVRALEERLGRVDAATKVLVQDTCFADRGGKSVGGPKAAEHSKGVLPLEREIRPVDGELRLYASRFFEAAVESVPLRGSVYTSHLLDALGQTDADLDEDGCIGLLEAHAWARARTTSDRGGLQVPVADTRDAPNLLLGCAPSAPARAVVDAAADERWRVSLIGPDGQRVEAGGLAPDRYRATVDRWVPDEDGRLVRRTLLDGPMRLHAGDWVDIGEEIRHRAPLLDLRATVGLAASPSLPRASIGVELARVARDRGAGRAWGGGAVRYAPGPGPDPDAGKRTIELLASGGLSLGISARPVGTGRIVAEIGPTLSLGLVLRDAYRPDTPGDRFVPALGTVVEPSLSLLAGTRAGSIRLGAGARLIPVARGDRMPIDVAPTLTLGAGPRLSR